MTDGWVIAYSEREREFTSLKTLALIATWSGEHMREYWVISKGLQRGEFECAG